MFSCGMNCGKQKWQQRRWRDEFSGEHGHGADTAEHIRDSRGAEISGGEVCADAAGGGAVSERGGGQKSLFETGNGAADGIVQGARRAMGAGAENEKWSGAGSGGFQYRESRSGGGLCGERVRNQSQDLFACEVQSGEARAD